MKLDDFRNTPFRMQDLSSVYSDCANLAMKAKRLERSGEIIRLKRGLYVLNPDAGARSPLNTFLIANHLYGPSYVSMRAALRYYGLIPEAVYGAESMTTGLSRSYRNSLGEFRYIHVSQEYYNIGVTVASEFDSGFMIAQPEKALCDLMVYTPYLNLRFQHEIREYLEEDIRFDSDELSRLNLDIISECARTSRKSNMLQQLIKFIEYERNN